jgi:choline dehydrogenase-like flavoprotein
MQEEMYRDPSGDRQLDVVVVGGGQAGLAMAWHLRRQGLRFVVLEAGPELGHVWRNRWDSLTLFTPAQYDALLGMPFPAPADTYPTKDPVADYLQAMRPPTTCPSASTPGRSASPGPRRASRSQPPTRRFTVPGRWSWPPDRSRSPSSRPPPAGWTPR